MRCPECGKILRRSAKNDKIAFVCMKCDYEVAPLIHR